jgi:signal transduction histidine kinase
VKEQTHKLADFLPDETGNGSALQHPKEQLVATAEKLFKIQRLLCALAMNFPDISLGIINREMKFGLVNRTDIWEIEFDSIDSINPEPPENSPRIDIPHLDESALIELKKAFKGENVFYEIKSNNRFYRITATPLRDENGQVSEVLCVMQNLTERKQMEEGLMKALDKEKELGELKSRFVTMASHEFRTPLTSILASTFLLENLSGSDYEKEKTIHTSRIKRSVNNLTTILNEFLSLQKLQENKVSVVRTNINIPEFIQDDLIGEMDVLKKAGQTIEYEHSGESMAHLDHHILWSIITNLLSNALKYSQQDGKIMIASKLKSNVFELEVSDHGIGIPEDEHKYIFGRFYRARNALNIEGTGLGLHIVQKYVHLLNGTITFESQLDKGTKFIVVLPTGSSEDLQEPANNLTTKSTSL